MRRLILLSAVTLLVVWIVAGPATADSGNRCFGVQGSATTGFVFDAVPDADPPIPGFVGDGAFNVGGTDVVVGAIALADIPGLTPRHDGSLVTDGAHILDFGEYGTVVTEDMAVLVPTGPGTFNLRSRLTVDLGGSGKLHLLPYSTLDLSSENPLEWSASWHMRGNVCFEG